MRSVACCVLKPGIAAISLAGVWAIRFTEPKATSRALRFFGPMLGTSFRIEVSVLVARCSRWFLSAKRCASSRNTCKRRKLAEVLGKIGDLPGVAIAVMGCIVNGPGEMADADFGYVGGAPGKIDLYVGKEVVKRGIDNDTACDELIQLIKDHGRWVEKEEEEEAVAA